MKIYVKFQSLTGTIHTRLWIKNKIHLKKVSIPHRYDSHLNAFENFLLYASCFNPSQVRFTPKTIYIREFVSKSVSIPHRYDSHSGAWCRWHYSSKFQSLTGTIHTKKMKKHYIFDEKFQSLTGTIHTRIFLRMYQLWYLVSIPHRYDSHFVLLMVQILKLLCFNPSQVRFTLV